MRAYPLRFTKGEAVASIQKVKSRFEQLDSPHVGCVRAF